MLFRYQSCLICIFHFCSAESNYEEFKWETSTASCLLVLSGALGHLGPAAPLPEILVITSTGVDTAAASGFGGSGWDPSQSCVYEPVMMQCGLVGASDRGKRRGNANYIGDWLKQTNHYNQLAPPRDRSRRVI